MKPFSSGDACEGPGKAFKFSLILRQLTDHFSTHAQHFSETTREFKKTEAQRVSKIKAKAVPQYKLCHIS